MYRSAAETKATAWPSSCCRGARAGASGEGCAIPARCNSGKGPHRQPSFSTVSRMVDPELCWLVGGCKFSRVHVSCDCTTRICAGWQKEGSSKGSTHLLWVLSLGSGLHAMQLNLMNSKCLPDTKHRSRSPTLRLAGWQVEVISGGITNLLWKLSPASSLEPVLLRVFGQDTDKLIDRQSEASNLRHLNGFGFGAKVGAGRWVSSGQAAKNDVLMSLMARMVHVKTCVGSVALPDMDKLIDRQSEASDLGHLTTFGFGAKVCTTCHCDLARL